MAELPNNRPRGREQHITGKGKDIYIHGEGLGTGPVGSPGGHAGRPGGKPGADPATTAAKVAAAATAAKVVSNAANGGGGNGGFSRAAKRSSPPVRRIPSTFPQRTAPISPIILQTW